MTTRDTTGQRSTTQRLVSKPVIALIGRRAAIGLATLLVVSFVIFFLTQALPGDVARTVLGPNATEAQLDALREELGLNQSVWAQYFGWLSRMVTLDFGSSLSSGTPVSDLLAVRAQNSLTVIGIAILFTLPLSFLLGVLAARRPGSWADHIISGACQAILSLPEFVVAVLLIVVFATGALGWFPPVSILDSREPAWQQPELLVLPIVTMVLIASPHLIESVKTVVREELGSEHIRWARLSGVPERRLLSRYALRNVLAPSLQVTATTIGFLIGGTVAVERAFSFPGIGSALVSAVANRDVVVVQAIAMAITAILVIAFIIADIVGTLVTPKLRGRSL